MESPSDLRSLSQTLALKKAQDSAEAANVTNHELQKLGHDLQRQSSAVLTTTAVAITQRAAREMQTFEQQIVPELDRMRQDVSEKLAQMQAQLDQQLQPLDENAMKARMGKLQGQINQQTKPLSEALAALKEDSQVLAAMTARSWFKPVAISLAILLAISLPVWGLTQYLASQVQSNLQTIQQQEKAIKEQRATLDQIRAQTWGIQFQEDKNGRFLILPPGAVPEAGWKFGNRQAVKVGKN